MKTRARQQPCRNTRQGRISGAVRAAGAVCLLALVLPAQQCFAAGGTAAWRSTYDTVMIWVNFIILVALLWKFLKKPLGDFLGSQQDALAAEIDRLTAQKEKAMADIAALQADMINREERFAAVTRNIIENGENERRELIEGAHRQAAIMMDSARQRIATQLRSAGGVLRAELVDAAMDLAMAQLPGLIHSEDADQWVDRFIHDIDASRL
jgi:F-type H+-transporting ATPase subunit b